MRHPRQGRLSGGHRSGHECKEGPERRATYKHVEVLIQWGIQGKDSSVEGIAQSMHARQEQEDYCGCPVGSGWLATGRRLEAQGTGLNVEGVRHWENSGDYATLDSCFVSFCVNVNVVSARRMPWFMLPKWRLMRTLQFGLRKPYLG